MVLELTSKLLPNPLHSPDLTLPDYRLLSNLTIAIATVFFVHKCNNFYVVTGTLNFFYLTNSQPTNKSLQIEKAISRECNIKMIYSHLTGGRDAKDEKKKRQIGPRRQQTRHPPTRTTTQRGRRDRRREGGALSAGTRRGEGDGSESNCTGTSPPQRKRTQRARGRERERKLEGKEDAVGRGRETEDARRESGTASL